MSIGYSTILQIRRVEAKASELGFMFVYPRYARHGSEGQEFIALEPKDSYSLPIYDRGVQLYRGTLNDIEHFMSGIEWARNYDYMLKVSTNQKRERKEQDARNKKLINLLKDKDDIDVTP